MRLGHDATEGLVEILELSQKEVRDALIATCTERFERRLIEEGSGLRMHVAQVGANLRGEMAQLGSDLRGEMAQLASDLRGEMAQLGSDLRREMAQLGSDLRREMGDMRIALHEEIATGRVELFKWCFLFWIGQVLAIGGMMAVMLRVMR